MLSGGDKQSLTVPASSLFIVTVNARQGFFSDWEDTFNFHIQAKLSDEYQHNKSNHKRKVKLPVYQHNKSNQKRKVKLPVFYQSTVIANKFCKNFQKRTTI